MLLFTSLVFLPFAIATHTNPSVHDPKDDITYIGKLTDGVEEFLSIRYGEDTGGEYRFTPPRPYVNKIAGAKVDVSKPGNACPQPEHPMPGDPWSTVENASEDGLFLRVTRPERREEEEKLPVMVWVYGGGHMVGNIYDVSYDPVGLVQNSVQSGNPVIYVAMNHRINIFGYPLSDAVLEPSDGTRANLGLRDQRLAMDWIREHISAFGGDPENITVFGEDTGASDIGLHIAAGNTPFRRAIAQSGSALSPWAIRHDASYKNTAEVITRIGCVSGTPQHWYSINCLRQFTMEQILDVTFSLASSLEPGNGFHVFGPALDHDIIGASPPSFSQALSTSHGIDYMTGWNMDELTMEIPTSIQTTSQAAAWLGQRYPQLIPPVALMALYPYMDIEFARRFVCPKDVSTAWCGLSRALRDIEVTCPSIRQAAAMFDASSEHNSVFMYELNQTAFAPTLEQGGKGYLGVVHFSDVPYVFNELDRAYWVSDPEELKLAKAISGSWAAFAATGSPARHLQWPRALQGQSKKSGSDEQQMMGVSSIEERQISLEVLGGPHRGPRELVFPEKRRCEHINKMAHFFQRA